MSRRDQLCVIKCDVHELRVCAHTQAHTSPSVARHVAVCCSVLQCVAVCCSALQCVALCCTVSHCVVLIKCVAVCCSVLQCVAVRGSVMRIHHQVRQYVVLVDTCMIDLSIITSATHV